MRITKISKQGLELICKWEGLKLIAYQCPAMIWTIGYGTTYYPDGTRVKKGDVIEKEYAVNLLMTNLIKYEKDVDNMTRDDINQNQFDALVSFAYNLGSQALKGSTLLKKINKNPNDPTIGNEFGRWVTADGKRLKGLVDRRAEEMTLYNKK